ncbi:MAG: helix-turn-helix transcriptional regulator [Pirellulales bacterium]
MEFGTQQRIDVGRRIKGARQANDLTAQQLAKLAGLSPGYLSEVERGLSAVSSEKLARIARVLQVTVDYLLEGPRETPKAEDEVRIPAALSAAAEQLRLSHKATLRLLQGKESLVAKRSAAHDADWALQDWVRFYKKVKDYLPND